MSDPDCLPRDQTIILYIKKGIFVPAYCLQNSSYYLCGSENWEDKGKRTVTTASWPGGGAAIEMELEDGGMCHLLKVAGSQRHHSSVVETEEYDPIEEFTTPPVPYRGHFATNVVYDYYDAIRTDQGFFWGGGYIGHCYQRWHCPPSNFLKDEYANSGYHYFDNWCKPEQCNSWSCGKCMQGRSSENFMYVGRSCAGGHQDLAYHTGSRVYTFTGGYSMCYMGVAFGYDRSCDCSEEDLGGSAISGFTERTFEQTKTETRKITVDGQEIAEVVLTTTESRLAWANHLFGVKSTSKDVWCKKGQEDLVNENGETIGNCISAKADDSKIILYVINDINKDTYRVCNENKWGLMYHSYHDVGQLKQVSCAAENLTIFLDPGTEKLVSTLYIIFDDDSPIKVEVNHHPKERLQAWCAVIYEIEGDEEEDRKLIYMFSYYSQNSETDEIKIRYGYKKGAGFDEGGDIVLSPYYKGFTHPIFGSDLLATGRPAAFSMIQKD